MGETGHYYFPLTKNKLTRTTSPLDLLTPRPALASVVAHSVGLADILREHGQPYLNTHALSVVQDKAWRAIVSCRPPVLGGHVECCDHCGVAIHVPFLSQSALPAVPDARQGDLARGEAAGTVAGVVFSFGVHLTPRNQRAGGVRSERAVQDAVRRGGGYAEIVRRQPALAGRYARLHAGTAHMEARPRAAYPCPCSCRGRGTDGRRKVGEREAWLPIPDRCAVSRVPGQVHGSARKCAQSGQAEL